MTCIGRSAQPNLVSSIRSQLGALTCQSEGPVFHVFISARLWVLVGAHARGRQSTSHQHVHPNDVVPSTAVSFVNYLLRRACL